MAADLVHDGTTVYRADISIGTQHRGFEKEAEHASYEQLIPYVERLNYVSPMLAASGYATTVEHLLGISKRVPERAAYIRVIGCELSRVCDHLHAVAMLTASLHATSLARSCAQLGQRTRALFESICGVDMLGSYCRIGGVAHDLQPGFAATCSRALPALHRDVANIRTQLEHHPAAPSHLHDLGLLTGEAAHSLGITGPALRACGVAYDVRKDQPYSVYDHFDFEIPVAERGDAWARTQIRLEEIVQSLAIVEQAARQIPPGRTRVEDPRIASPADTSRNLPHMIAHFARVADGICVPPGEHYGCIEAANGELGFYLVADGSGRPVRCRARTPSFYAAAALPHLLVGAPLQQVPALIDSFNINPGACDR